MEQEMKRLGTEKETWKDDVKHIQGCHEMNNLITGIKQSRRGRNR